MTLSIVAVNWNSKELIKDCIESIFNTNAEKFTNADYELIIIDNASSDGSNKYLESLGSKIVLIQNQENYGYARACNQGMKIAKGKFILLLGSDTRMCAGTLEACCNFLEQNAEAGAVGCRLLNQDGTVQNNCKKFPTLANAFFTYLSLDSFNKDYDMASFNYDKTAEVDQIATTFLMLKKEVVDKAGMFDEQYKIMYNDVDLCKRIILSGYKIFFLHTVSAYHHGSHSTRRAGYRLRKIMYGDIYRYYKGTFGFKAVFLYPILAFRLLLVSSIKG